MEAGDATEEERGSSGDSYHMARIIGAGTAAYSDPGADAALLGGLSGRMPVKVLEIRNDWARITIPSGINVWVFASYIAQDHDGQARVHVTAIDVTGGLEATTEIVRPENVVTTEVDGETDEESPSEDQADQSDQADQKDQKDQGPATPLDDFQVEKWADSTDAVAVQLPDDDDEILDLSKPTAPPNTTPGGRKRARRKKKSKTRTTTGDTPGRTRSSSRQKSAGERQTIKPPPLPPGLESSQDSKSAEDEFWNLPDS